MFMRERMHACMHARICMYVCVCVSLCCRSGAFGHVPQDAGKLSSLLQSFETSMGSEYLGQASSWGFGFEFSLGVQSPSLSRTGVPAGN